MSKTDPDATFMRMKEDHMQNGELKPGYNLQASTNNQFIVHYSLAQTTADTTTLINHLEGFEQAFEQAPETLTADAGYGSEENYQALENRQVDALVKYNYFHKEQRQAKALVDKNPFHADRLHYNTQTDTYYCPMGQPMNYIGERQRETTTGYVQTYHRYQASNCQGCPLRGVCHQSKGNRIIERNHKLIAYKKQARERLLSERGIAHRKRRCWEIGAVFGNIKHNMNYKRCMLRGIEKVETEIGLSHSSQPEKTSPKKCIKHSAPI